MKTFFPFSPDVTLPVTIMTARSAVFGVSGSGKSNTAVVIVEQLLSLGEQIVLVDPKGEGYGLQTSADGKSPAFDVIVFGQPHGDIPELREEHAEGVADLVVDSGRSVVLSLLGFEDDNSQRRFVTRFIQRLYRRKANQPAKTRTLVVVEEAHLIVPEHASGGNAEMVGAIKRIARQGRTAGLGLMIVDQRPQEVAKSVISQCELLICHQLTHKLDREALHDWIKAFETNDGQGILFLESLAVLKKGECWVWSPAWLNLFVRTRAHRRTTFDSGATPDGAVATAPVARASVNIETIQAMMAAVPEPADVTTNKELRALLKEQREKIDAMTAANQSPVPVIAPELMKMAAAAQDHANAILSIVRAAAESAGLVVDDASPAVIRVSAAAPATAAVASPVPAVRGERDAVLKPIRRRKKRRAKRLKRSEPRSGKELARRGPGGRVQRLLQAACAVHALGQPVSKRTICRYLGVTENSGSLNDTLRVMEHARLIVRSFPSRGQIDVRLTDLGLAKGKSARASH